jgi:hypothetical protein
VGELVKKIERHLKVGKRNQQNWKDPMKEAGI